MKDKYIRPRFRTAVSTCAMLLSFFYISATEAPRLAVIISVNGLRSHDIEAYSTSLSSDGFMRIITSGQYQPDAPCTYIASDPATDYASMVTGSTPNYHGIVSQKFFSLIDDAIVSCIDDARYDGINTALNVSPRLLQASTIADQLKLTHPDSKIYSVSIDPESAIMTGGHLADGAIWIDNSTEKIATSNFYDKGLPRWAEKINNDSLIQNLYKQQWIAQQELRKYRQMPLQPYFGEQRPVFLKFKDSETEEERMRKFKQSPLINDVMKELAVRALRDEMLGTDNAPDLLFVEFNARIPMGNGVMSAEKEDLLIRLDRNIGLLLDAIEISVGFDNTVLVLTAPNYRPVVATTNTSQKLNYGAFNSRRSMALLNAYLMAIYGQGRWIAGYYNRNINLNKPLIEEHKIKLNEIQEYAAQFMTEFTGVHSATPAYQIRTASSMPGELPSRMRNSHYKNRSGDVVLTLLPGWIETDESTGSSVRPSMVNPLVPLAIIADGITPQSTTMNIEDLCPTLCRMLRIPYPNACTGTAKILSTTASPK